MARANDAGSEDARDADARDADARADDARADDARADDARADDARADDARAAFASTGDARVDTDICVIGAGSAGLSVAAGAVQMGARVTLIEAGEMGGDCLNTGCVPSKALIAAARHAHAMRAGGPFGVAPVEPEVDFAAVKDHVARVIAAIAPVDSQARFEGLGVRVLRAHARFTGPHEVVAGGTRVRARRFVIATGSRPAVPPIEGLGDVPYLTNETIFALRERPEHLIVIGGGPIGMEMAQAHRRLGCRVTVVEGARAFGRDDPETAGIVLAAIRAEGVEVLEGTKVARVSGREGAVRVTLAEAGGGSGGGGSGGGGNGDAGSGGGGNGDGGRSDGKQGEGARPGRAPEGARTIEGSHLLLAAGRRVDLGGMGLDAAGVEHTAKGVTVDAHLRSSNRRVYAAGDAAGGMQFTHVAAYHAGLLVRQLVLALPARVSHAHIPWATYTDPELAQVGMTEAQAREAHGDRLEVQRVSFAHNDRAQAERRTEGLLKLMAVGGRPVGASIAGAHAGDLIAPWAMAIAAGVKLGGVTGTVLPYPTLGEVSKRAAGAHFTPLLFESKVLRGVVRLIQRWVP